MDEIVVGLQDLLAKLSDSGLPLTMEKVLIARAVGAGCDVIAERMAELAPHDTGFLSEHIMRTVTQQTATEAIGKIGPSKDAAYGMPEEVGSIHNPAQPFARPAFDEKRDEALKVMGDVLSEGIEREMTKR